MPVLFVLGPLLVVATCWLPPVDEPVADPFRPPACAWCPGNRGIEFATAPGEEVQAVDGGIVTFSGVVAGIRYVVVRHADGRRATYGGLASTTLERGDTVVARATIGSAGGPLHFGVRDGDHYVDPAPMLGRLERRVRLVPSDGSAARAAAPAPRLRCDAS